MKSSHNTHRNTMKNRRKIALHDLLAYEGHEFINNAYSVLLDRRPDFVGESYYAKRLAAGVSKEQVIDQILQSEEVKSLRSEIVVTGYHRPIMGWKFQSWLNLPRTISSLVYQTSILISLMRKIQLSIEGLSTEKQEQTVDNREYKVDFYQNTLKSLRYEIEIRDDPSLHLIDVINNVQHIVSEHKRLDLFNSYYNG